MRKRDEVSDGESCLSRAKPMEMLFVLLSRDPAAPVAIRAWIAERIRLGKNQLHDAQVEDAEWCAAVMETEGRDCPDERMPMQQQAIELHPVESSQIRAIGYDEATSTVAVQFSSGSVYYYHHVSPAQYAEFQAAESKGRWHGTNLKDRAEYPFTKMSGPDGLNKRTPRPAADDPAVF